MIADKKMSIDCSVHGRVHGQGGRVHGHVHGHHIYFLNLLSKRGKIMKIFEFKNISKNHKN